MNSGSSNGGFSIPLLPCRYFLLKHQWRGTGTVFLVAFRWTSSLGSWAVTSCISTTSGRATSWSTETGDIRLLIVLKVFLSNISHLSLIYLFEFSHSQPVHPPQLLLWEFRYIWSDFLYNKKKSFTCKQRGFSPFCFAFQADGRIQTSSLSSLSFLSSSNPFFRGAVVSCFSAFSGSFSFSFFTSSVS